ncbi:uncharacterized protein BDZ99DRAFT_525784 [Mytilinidion resinicola]|uniref:Uncharacterized protein n=1 Tax=Mytilinidion resinicola TaxID=574789 RepID=A0A6A6Y6P4_9PEZI|nr:uncharacterized protein BDZ99DRAFT_525784 [Mytilinidion resinicola]KAF2804193.1 hypothetical protein BDZ99DRAFT_525784 [Mytilinidion resinicola]
MSASNNANAAASNAPKPPTRADFVFLHRDVEVPYDTTACPYCITLSCPCGTLFRACKAHEADHDNFTPFSRRVLGPTPHNAYPPARAAVPDIEDAVAVAPTQVVQLVKVVGLQRQRAAAGLDAGAGNAFVKAEGVFALEEICPVASVMEGVWRVKGLRARNPEVQREGAVGVKKEEGAV